jgi:hypothetical protein
MPNVVFLHKPLAPDSRLGRVSEDGKVFRSRLGPGLYLGRVDVATGIVYGTRLGPDRKIGRVDGESGKIYLSRLGPDEYIGRVSADGKLRLHRALGPDDYIGRVKDMTSMVHAGAALLLLVLPTLDELAGQEQVE